MEATKDKLRANADKLETKLASLRSGGADSALLDVLSVETNGGARVPLRSVAVVAVTSPREMLVAFFVAPSRTRTNVRGGTRLVHVHDVALLADVERAIATSSLNLTPQANKAKGTIVVPVPKTTKEQREARVKMASEMAEAARAENRRVRQEMMKKLKAAGLPKDDLERAEKQAQKLMDVRAAKSARCRN